MATTAPTATTATQKRVRMDPLRRTSLVAGGFYLLSFVSIPTLWLYGPARNADFAAGAGSDSGLLLAAFLEIIVAVACIGTAVSLFPVVKRQNEATALGFVGTRTLEAAVIFVGVISMLTIVTLRKDASGGDPAALAVAGKTLTGIYDWTFLLGQTLMPALNALLLGSLMYRSRLVPRLIPTMGLIGSPILLTSITLAIFGVLPKISVLSGIATIFIAGWELSLGIYLVVKGFRPTPITAAITAENAAADQRESSVTERQIP
ncbi:DUF4386 domain-containing protein [Nakamurella sp. GG22]